MRVSVAMYLSINVGNGNDHVSKVADRQQGGVRLGEQHRRVCSQSILWEHLEAGTRNKFLRRLCADENEQRGRAHSGVTG